MTEIRPITVTEARGFVNDHHRHNEAALGYRRVVTYTLQEETGASLKASGFECVADIGARSWRDSSVARHRYDETLFGPRNNAANVAKYRWERLLAA